MITKYEHKVTALSEELAAYRTRPTKACSLRIRTLSKAVGNMGVALRKELIKKDKEK